MVWCCLHSKTKWSSDVVPPSIQCLMWCASHHFAGVVHPFMVQVWVSNTNCFFKYVGAVRTFLPKS